MKNRILLCVVVTILWFPCFAQSIQSSEAILEARKQRVFLHHAESYVAHVVTGERYHLSHRSSDQFFLERRPTEGILVYDGIVFKDIEVQYNLYSQQVIVLLESKNSERYASVALDRISEFSILEHEFVHVQDDSTMAKGIYELAYAGSNSSVFIKRTKREQETTIDMALKTEFIPINRYYVSNEFGTFHIIGKRSLLQAYQNSEKLSAILKKYKIKFSKKQFEQGLVQAISYLDPNSEPK